MSTSDDRATKREFRKLDRILDELLEESRTAEKAHEWLKDTWIPAEISARKIGIDSIQLYRRAAPVRSYYRGWWTTDWYQEAVKTAPSLNPNRKAHEASAADIPPIQTISSEDSGSEFCPSESEEDELQDDMRDDLLDESVGASVGEIDKSKDTSEDKPEGNVEDDRHFQTRKTPPRTTRLRPFVLLPLRRKKNAVAPAPTSPPGRKTRSSTSTKATGRKIPQSTATRNKTANKKNSHGSGRNTRLGRPPQDKILPPSKKDIKIAGKVVQDRRVVSTQEEADFSLTWSVHPTDAITWSTSRVSQMCEQCRQVRSAKKCTAANGYRCKRCIQDHKLCRGVHPGIVTQLEEAKAILSMKYADDRDESLDVGPTYATPEAPGIADAGDNAAQYEDKNPTVVHRSTRLLIEAPLTLRDTPEPPSRPSSPSHVEHISTADTSGIAELPCYIPPPSPREDANGFDELSVATSAYNNAMENGQRYMTLASELLPIIASAREIRDKRRKHTRRRERKGKGKHNGAK